jgi:hypothetical protein
MRIRVLAFASLITFSAMAATSLVVLNRLKRSLREATGRPSGSQNELSERGQPDPPP